MNILNLQKQMIQQKLQTTQNKGNKNESWKEHLQGDLSALKELVKFQK